MPVKGITVVNIKYLTTYLSKQQESLISEDIQTITRVLQGWVSKQDKLI
jgi:hypothetical protein